MITSRSIMHLILSIDLSFKCRAYSVRNQKKKVCIATKRKNMKDNSIWTNSFRLPINWNSDFWLCLQGKFRMKMQRRMILTTYKVQRSTIRLLKTRAQFTAATKLLSNQLYQPGIGSITWARPSDETGSFRQEQSFSRGPITIAVGEKKAWKRKERRLLKCFPKE